MRIGNFLENRQILNYHCPDHRSKVFVEQQLFSTCFRHNGLGKHTLYPGTKKVKNLYIVVLTFIHIIYIHVASHRMIRSWTSPIQSRVSGAVMGSCHSSITFASPLPYLDLRLALLQYGSSQHGRLLRLMRCVCCACDEMDIQVKTQVKMQVKKEVETYMQVAYEPITVKRVKRRHRTRRLLNAGTLNMGTLMKTNFVMFQLENVSRTLIQHNELCLSNRRR